MAKTLKDGPTKTVPTHAHDPGACSRTENEARCTSCTVERRSQERVPLTAAATLVDTSSGTRLDARTADIATTGCYIDTMNPFPVGTLMQLRLTKNGEAFHAEAKVAYCKLGVGMGVIFTAAAPEQLLALEKWIKQDRGEVSSDVKVLDLDPLTLSGENFKDQERYALEELLIVLMRKGLLTDEEGDPILRRLMNGSSPQNPLPV